jgi:4-hydroxyacetophenone monooxygenase
VTRGPIDPRGLAHADDAVLANAVEHANLAALVPVLCLLTGDASLIERFRPPAPSVLGDQRGGMSESQQAEIRALALEVLRDLRDRPRPLPPLPPDETLRALLSWSVADEVRPEYLPVILEETRLSGADLRRFEWNARPPAEKLAGFRVLIIGAGLGGVCAAIRLQEAGIPYTILEKNPDVGGTWLENSYPGCRVDVANHFYSYSFEPNPDWSDYYARRDELEGYVEHCADKYGVRSRIRFETEVVAATWIEERRCWRVRVRTRSGAEETLEADALISAVGMLNRPQLPAIEGLESFAGPCFHSARWRHDVEWSGKRVAVIGTGASAMQFVPELARQVKRLSIFQRSPQWAAPSPNYLLTVPDGKKWLLRHVPYYLGWYRFILLWNVGDAMYPAFCVDPDWPEPKRSIGPANDALRELMTAHMRAELGNDPELVRKALPEYPPLGKRILLDNGWFRTLVRPNVELVTDPIRAIEPAGVVTEKEGLHSVDVLVLSTGFHAGKFLWPMEIRGRGGVRLHDLWDEGENPRAYLGITVPRFPNLFCLYGPNTNPVVGSVIFMLECQVRYVLGCLREMLERGHRTLECRQDVHDAYNERLDAQHERMVWRHPRVRSYYNNRAGRVITNVPWRLIDYWRMTRAPDPADFVAT